MSLSKKHKILLIILIISVFLWLNKFGGQQIRNTFCLISSPLNKIFWRAGDSVAEFAGALFKIRTLRKENQELSKENLTLLQKFVSQKALQEENRTLRDALGLAGEKKFELFLTEVIAKNTEQDSLRIRGGTKQGLRVSMPVITKEGVLVGRIKECLADFSTVILITSPKNVFDVEIYPPTKQSEENVLGVAKGKGNLKIDLQLVPKESQIEEGALVLTTTLGGNFPKGLLVGKVKEVRKAAAEPFQEGEIEPYFIKLGLGILFVITNY